MPTRPPALNWNMLIERQLDECLHELEEELNADVLVFSGSIHYGADRLIRDALELRSDKER